MIRENLSLFSTSIEYHSLCRCTLLINDIKHFNTSGLVINKQYIKSPWMALVAWSVI